MDRQSYEMSSLNIFSKYSNTIKQAEFFLKQCFMKTLCSPRFLDNPFA